MVFPSLTFALLFAVTWLVWRGASGRRRTAVLLVASYLFYAGWDPRFVPLLWFSTALDYVVGRRLERERGPGRRRAWLAASLVGNLGVLAAFKYAGGQAFHSPDVFHTYGQIPPGLSFYTFQTLSYTIDIYRGRQTACRRWTDFALFVAFFPQLVAGPVVRARELLPQIRAARTPEPHEIVRGVELFAVGLFKKVVIADHIGLVIDTVYADPGAWSGAALTATGLLFAIQVYCDFSGYSTMARGLGATMGFRLPRNFDYPLLARTPLAFARGWHITMSTWFRDYVFHPLGGSRVGPMRVAFNIVVVWALFGLWHGAAWTFVGWGLYNGVVQALERERRRRGWSWPSVWNGSVGQWLMGPAGWLVNLAIVVGSAHLFRAGSIGDAAVCIVRGLSGASDGRSAPAAWWTALAVLGAAHWASKWWWHEDWLAHRSAPAQVAALAILTTAIVLFAPETRPFIYFQF